MSKNEGPSKIEYPFPDSERFLVLLNRGASGGPVETLRRQLGGAFSAKGVPFDIVEPSDREEAFHVTRAAAKRGYRAVVAVGGDGTVGVALRGTAGTEVPVAIVPCGTGNQLALNFGIPSSLAGGGEPSGRRRSAWGIFGLPNKHALANHWVPLGHTATPEFPGLGWLCALLGGAGRRPARPSFVGDAGVLACST